MNGKVLKMTDINTIGQAKWNWDNSYSRLPRIFFTNTNPTPVQSPKLVVLNRMLAVSLGLNTQNLQSEEGVDVFAGNKIPVGSVPIAQAYAGHQFGHFTILGDGRAILLGEHINPAGERFDVQLKGSGRTLYSRGGDGRAVLGPMLREYIISEAMYALGIATTRSLAVVTTGEPVYRETVQQGAILTRIAASHIRVGTFQYASARGSVGDLKVLADYTLKRHFPYVDDTESRYLSLLKEVIKRQAELIAKWQSVGFIHGVMNTDNMALSGETIDYGPCAFMDAYDPDTVFSSIDYHGRYAYGNQPDIAVWNLARFAETLLPLLHDEQDDAIDIAKGAISEFTQLYKCNWLRGMRSKLGIYNEEPADETLIQSLLELMLKYRADYNNTFRALTFDRVVDSDLFKSSEFCEWYKRWESRLSRQEQAKELTLELMKKSNPAVIPRNHRVEEALKAATEGDYSIMEKLSDVLSKPYEHLPEQEDYDVPAPPSASSYRTFCGT